MINFKNYILPFFALILASCGHERVTDARSVATLPEIYPDYVGVTIPSSIAPLNFVLCDDPTIIDVVLKNSNGAELHSQGKQSTEIDIDAWHKLLNNSIGDSIQVTVSAKYTDGWRSYLPFSIYISQDSIDYGLVYRLIAPGYEVYSHLGIYERDLSNYNECPIIENTQIDGCLNCHSFNQCDSKDLSLHVRGPHGATLIRKNGEMKAIETKTDVTLAACVYPYWHPEGRYIAYSTNNTRQAFHATPEKRLEVFDLASDVQVYDTEADNLLVPSILKNDSVWETFPAFSPDGKQLYFCAAAARPIPAEIKEVRYDLCRIDFDPATGSFGTKIDTLVNASAVGKSISFPRPSFDGRHLMYALSDYGNFSIWHPESDLWILDLATGETLPLEAANSDNAESYHNWSSNNRWFVFGSRREDGLHTCAYICHISPDGKADKPFLLPQKKPRLYYDNQYRSYNIPEFITAPVNLDRIEAEDILMDSVRIKITPQIIQ